MPPPSEATSGSASRVVDVGEPGVVAPADQATARERRVRPFAWLDALLAAFWNNLFLFGALAILAVLSGVWGFVEFYGPQYGRVPWYLWPFVPDSPLAVSAWLVAAFAVKMGWDARPGAEGAAWTFFGNWAIVWNAKIGIWTAFVLLYYADVFFAGTSAQQAFQWMLLAAHLGMVGLALLLFRRLRPLSATGYAALLAIVFLWDFVDYFFVQLFLPGSSVQVFPLGVPAEPVRLRVTALVSLALSAGLTLALAVGMRLRGPPSPR